MAGKTKGQPEMGGELRADDLYPDAVRSVAGLRTAGYRVAVTANQPARRRSERRRCRLDPSPAPLKRAA